MGRRDRAIVQVGAEGMLVADSLNLREAEAALIRDAVNFRGRGGHAGGPDLSGTAMLMSAALPAPKSRGSVLRLGLTQRQRQRFHERVFPPREQLAQCIQRAERGRSLAALVATDRCRSDALDAERRCETGLKRGLGETGTLSCPA